MGNRRIVAVGLAVIGLLVLWQVSATPEPKKEIATPIGNVPASQTKEYVLDVGESTILEFGDLNGAVTIFAGPPGQVKVFLTRRSLGVDKQSAMSDLQSFAVEPEQKGDTISFGLGKNAKPGRQVDYKVTAPPNTSVKIANGSGTMTVGEVTGDIEVNAQSLNATLTDIRGAISIHSDVGSIKITNGTGATDIRSRASTVQLDRVTGDTMVVVTGGNTTIKDSGAESSATFQIQKGDLTLTRFRAQTLTATAPDGQIRINESSAQAMDLQTKDGTINLFRVNSEQLRVTTTSGGLTFDQVVGAFEVKTDNGAVNLTEVAASAIAINAGSGNVLFYGTLPTNGEHSIKTTSGTISIFVVKESAFRLDASTRGSITIVPPFVLGSANTSPGRSRGVINQGSTLLNLSSGSGDILITSEQPF